MNYYSAINECGDKYWLNERAELHREDGPAIEWSNGSKEWYINGLRHREDGPAREYPDGSKFWWVNGQKHRLDGPAEEYYDGSKFWHINGHQILCSSQEEFERLIKLRIFW